MNKITSVILFHIMYVIIPGIAALAVFYIFLRLGVHYLISGIACVLTLNFVGNYFDYLQIKLNKKKRKPEVIVDNVSEVVSGDSSRSSILKDE